MVEWPTSSMEIFIYLHVLVSLEMEECPHLPGVQGSYFFCAGLYICFACFGLISLHLSPVSLLVYVDFSHWNHLSFLKWLSWTCFDLCYGLMDLFCIAQSYYLLRTATSICPHLLSSTALSSGSIGQNVYGLICNSSLYFLNIIYMMIFSLKKSRWLEVQFPELKKNKKNYNFLAFLFVVICLKLRFQWTSGNKRKLLVVHNKPHKEGNSNIQLQTPPLVAFNRIDLIKQHLS